MDPELGMSGEILHGRDFSGTDVMSFSAYRAAFHGCRFDDVRIRSATFGSVEASLYEDCSFDRARIENGRGRARFVRCSFGDAKLVEWDGSAMEFVDCVFTGRLRLVTFYGRVTGALEFSTGVRIPKVNEFHGNDFSRANLRESSFRFGVDLSRQSLPVGDGYLYLADVDDAVSRARPVVQRWQQPLRRQGEFLLDLLERESSYGQHQTCLRRSEWATNDGRRAAMEVLSQAGDRQA